MATAYLGRGLQGVADVGNASAISAQYLATTVNAIRTSGYSTTGVGAGVYASDSQATSTLAAAHPRFCKQSADGRYWRLLPETSGFISVMQGGAVGNGSTDDYAAIQAAINYGLSLGGATIYFPAGTYKVNTTPTITHGKGINLLGEGPDRSIISAGAFPAMATVGYWRSRVTGIGFWCDGNTTGGAFQLDGEPDGSFGSQGIVFTNCYFFGNYSSKYAFTNCRVAGGSGQGSENVWIGCGFAGTRAVAGDAAFLCNGSNALNNTILGCNFQAFTTGVLVTAGNVDVLHCGFQAIYAYDNIVNGGYDVDNSSGTSGDTVTMTGCRTESLQIYNGGGSLANISNFGQQQGLVSGWSSGAKVLNQLVQGQTAAGNVKAYRCTTAGTTSGSAPVWPESGTVADGSVVWTQLDFNVFNNVNGKISYGQMQLGQFGGASRTFIEHVNVTRDDCFAFGQFTSNNEGPHFSDLTLGGVPPPGSPLRPIKYGNNAPGLNTSTNVTNFGNRAAVWSGGSGGATSYDLIIRRGGGGAAYKTQNWFETTGGWSFGNVIFDDIFYGPASAEGVVFFVTDGTPGSSPLTGGGTGCLAVRQNGAWRAIATGSGAGGVADGDKGDITVSSSGATWTIDNGAVSLAKMAGVATGTVFYRKTAGTGDPEVQTLATLKTDLGLSGTNTGDQSSVSGNAGTATALQSSRNFSISGGGITAATVAFNGTANVVLSASVDAGHITLARMADVATGTVFYRKTAGTGAPEVQTLATLKTDLGLSGTNTGDQSSVSGNAGTATALQTSRNLSISGAGITAAAVGFDGTANVALSASVDAGHVTLARMANLAANSFIGNNTGVAATPLALTGTQATALLDAFTSGAKGLAPASGGGTTNFLRANGTWAAPSGSGDPEYVDLGLRPIAHWQSGSAAVPIAVGEIAPTATGTGTATTVATTNTYTATRITEYLVTTASTAAVAGFRGAANKWFMSNNANRGGFIFICRFGPATGVATTTNRCFVGMSNNTAAPTDIEPSTQTSIIGAGWDAADTNIQIMRNDATGTATKIDLGANFPVPTTDRTKIYELRMDVAPNSTTVNYRFFDLDNPAQAVTGTLTTDLPAVNALLSPRGWMSVGGTSSVIGIALATMVLQG